MAELATSPLPWYRLPQAWIRRIYNWTISWSESPYGAVALFAIAFAESSFFPIPPDVLLIALCVGSQKKSFRFAAICGAGSVLGGMAGYGIGWGLWGGLEGWFIPHVFSQEVFDKVVKLYEQNAFWTVFTAAFTPIPYKVITIAAGVCHIPFTTLVVGSLLGRNLRFFLVGGMLYFFGAPVKVLIEKYFEILSVAFTALLIGSFVLLKYVL
jgi:membrane protein YqaA with SNARE-associated domain